MRSFVEANQEIGRLHVHSRDVPAPDAEPTRSLTWRRSWSWWNAQSTGVELPDYAGVPDSRAPAGPRSPRRPSRRATASGAVNQQVLVEVGVRGTRAVGRSWPRAPALGLLAESAHGER